MNITWHLINTNKNTINKLINTISCFNFKYDTIELVIDEETDELNR